MSAASTPGPHWYLMNSSSRDLSRVLFEARERVEMQVDTVEAQTGKRDDWGRRLVTEIDSIRAREQWSPDGFGSEA
jgi:hypothetical protein